MFKNPPIPLLAGPTTAGTGSEVSGSRGCADTNQGVKRTVNHPRFNRARQATLDPLALITLPASVAAHAGTNALAHAPKSLLSLEAGPLTEGSSLYGTELVAKTIRPYATVSTMKEPCEH